MFSTLKPYHLSTAVAFVIATSIVACARRTETNVDGRSTAAPSEQSKNLVHASYYGDERWIGRPTASGEKFNPEALTAAHRSLPFGTRVRVTNPDNGRSVVVRINDRGPYVTGRTLDLSAGAAREIGIINAGVSQVEIETLSELQ